MKQFFFNIVFASMFLLSCGQTKTILRAWAFSKQSSTGIMRQDEAGHPINTASETDHFIYVEIKGKAIPVVDSAFIDGLLMSAGVYPVSEAEYQNAIHSDQKNSISRPAAKNSLWRIELTPYPKTIKKSYHEKIRIKGRIAGKPFIYTTDIEIRLAPDVRG